MYPNLYFFFKDVFGVEWNALKLVNSFGFFVALSFLAAAWIVTKELQRKQQAGLLTFKTETITFGGSAPISELVINAIMGFLFGFKLAGVFFTEGALNDPQAYILSSQGNFAAGVVVAFIFAGLKWYDYHKLALPVPEKREVRIWPHDRVGDLVIYAAIFGFAGAKLFHNFENWNEFVANPLEALISFSGLTFYGGLICAGLAIVYYARKNNIAVPHLADAMAPALMLAYALGRVGCQVSGDGDWGILNTAFISGPDGSLIPATADMAAKAIETNSSYYLQQFGALNKVPSLHVNALSFLPNWFFAYNYPHNVLSEGITIANCSGMWCQQLPVAVFPTPFYETLACLLLFGGLWFIRKKIQKPGMLFGIYLFVNGFERFWIEKIRVNTQYTELPFQPTQAELIALFLMLLGSVIVYRTSKAKLVQQ